MGSHDAGTPEESEVQCPFCEERMAAEDLKLHLQQKHPAKRRGTRKTPDRGKPKPAIQPDRPTGSRGRAGRG